MPKLTAREYMQQAWDLCPSSAMETLARIQMALESLESEERRNASYRATWDEVNNYNTQARRKFEKLQHLSLAGKRGDVRTASNLLNEVLAILNTDDPECPLCGKPSDNDSPHKACTDQEAAAANV